MGTLGLNTVSKFLFHLIKFRDFVTKQLSKYTQVHISLFGKEITWIG